MNVGREDARMNVPLYYFEFAKKSSIKIKVDVTIYCANGIQLILTLKGSTLRDALRFSFKHPASIRIQGTLSKIPHRDTIAEQVIYLHNLNQ